MTVVSMLLKCMQVSFEFYTNIYWMAFGYEPVHEKTNNLGFRPGPIQTRLYSHRRNLES